MPIIKSAKKAAKQNLVKNARNVSTRRRLHGVQKDLTALVKDAKKAEATELLNKVYKTVDTAAKKNVIPFNRASRLKAKAARQVASLV